jgi:meiotic recombination protein REC8
MTRPFSSSWSTALAVFLCVFSALTPLIEAQETVYIEGTNAQGVTQLLANDRYPALYTSDFGDCLGGQSLINVTGFDAAYYADNMTVLFHLEGTTNIRNESIMSRF